MEKNETAFIKQSLMLTRDWDDFQALIRRCRTIIAIREKGHSGKQ
ncbi:hypothetical protein [Desulfopila aestuarii]|uniref:Uncharacterized protein n=1 Tax=Desulfopila aestuarii DSM 18488 TaxID=1121416 RepID=A0A1M7YEL7_9BACT|nr:hypothetical protein [Desulfopila aestuarii]SHO51085.1 hypothetical protein SAMN02745220_03832 [Desulfopila aestuarii DSM 18488]